jgi:hypothetical protein
LELALAAKNAIAKSPKVYGELAHPVVNKMQVRIKVFILVSLFV